MTEYFCVAHNGPSGAISTSYLLRVEAETPEEALKGIFTTYKPTSGWFAEWVYSSLGAYMKKEKPILQWLSAWAQTRILGISCMHCGDPTKVVHLRANVGGYDEYKCAACAIGVFVHKNGSFIQKELHQNEEESL